MSEAMTQQPATPGSDVRLKRWEYHAFVIEAYMLIAAASVLLGLVRHSSPAVLPAGVFLVVSLALTPFMSVYIRIHKNRQIDAIGLAIWSVVIALVLGLMMVVFQM